MADNVGPSEQEDGRKRESPIELSDDENNIICNSAESPKLSSSKTGQSTDSAIDGEVTEKDPAKEAAVQILYNTIRNRFSQMGNNGDTKVAPKNDLSSETSAATRGCIKRSDSVEKLRNLIWMAEYEAFQDPYRGIGLLQHQQKQRQDDDDDEVMELLTNGKKQVTPWDACQFGILSHASTADMVSQALRQPDMHIPKEQQHSDGSLILDPKNPETLVRYLTEAQCPSLVAWTRQAVDEAAKKRASLNKKRRGKKRSRIDEDNRECTVSLGKRPSDPKYRCPCDYNPFCLGSMGGIVNDILRDRCENDVSISIPDYEEDEDKVGSGINKTNFVKRLKGGNILKHLKTSNQSKHDDTIQTNSVEVVEIDKSIGGAISTVASQPSQQNNTMDSMSGETDRFKYGAVQAGENETHTSKVAWESHGGVLVCKRLQPRKRKLPVGQPGDVYTEVLEQQDLDEIKYSKATKEEMEKLRKSREMECNDIQSTLHGMLKTLAREQCTNSEEYMEAISEWHKSLLFVVPTAEEKLVPDGRINMALPPGIQNLGATCYLNTQLQCLAQNPVFLEGIFSWRAVNNGHNMNAVMTTLQKLLAQMIFGGDCKLSTLDFSNALGLEHYEQQDPNEFARLLFDRMEESFQQCSNFRPEGSGQEPDLSDLLRRIFHGTTTYETTCMKCNNVSLKTEGFMDLNLPIVAPVSKPPENGKGKKIDGTIEAAFAKQAKGSQIDTNVQACLDQYLEAELMDGDNKYFCEICKSLQAAKRVPKLTGLPPVLNVQLSRYVFDREKLIKKKLSDKVLLSKVLTPYPNGSRNELKRYKLCAVMKHQGTSAYSGHYIAEAMDWTTGVWYEFNDETVKVLPKGPSCSYDPDSISDSSDDDLEPSPALLFGSQDAYNMYYVDENYMARKGLETIKRRQGFADRGLNGDNAKNNVLIDVLKERANKYSVLGEMCMFDWAVSDRLKRRKVGIRKYMFHDCISLTPSANPAPESLFWVDGRTLRGFLSCTSGFDEILNSGDPIVCPSSVLCPHGLLSPENAIQGKLLEKPIYDAFVSLLEGERKLLRDTGPEGDVRSVVGTICKASENVLCKECCDRTKADSTAKIEQIRNLADLYTALQDDKKEDVAVKESDCIYLVTRSWATGFKKRFSALLKSTENSDEGGCLVNGKDDPAPVLAGVADIDLRAFIRQGAVGEEDLENKECQASGSKVLDGTVNRKITCTHGNHVPVSKNITRFVGPQTWAMIKIAFPCAIEHKVSKERGTSFVSKEGCSVCDQERESLQLLRDDVEQWVDKMRKKDALTKVLSDKRTCSRDIGICNFDASEEHSRLVYRYDIENFRRAVQISKRVLKSNEVGIVKERLEKIAFPPFHSVVYEFEKESICMLLSSLRSLICRAHKQVISTAVFEQGVDEKNILSKHVVVLTKEEYHAYVVALSELLGILDGDRVFQTSEKEDETDCKVLRDLFDDLKTYHPCLNKNEDDTDSSSTIVLRSPDGNYKKYNLSPNVICTCETCLKEFAPLLEAHKPEEDENIDNVSVESDIGGRRQATGTAAGRAGVGGEAANPIMVESDSEADPNTYRIRVFELKAESTLQDATAKLREATGQSSGTDEDTNGFFLRRSSRKRKTIFPVGCITKETNVTLGLHYNLAAVRLFLYERCEIPLSSQLLAAFVPSDQSSVPFGIALQPTSNEEPLEDVLRELKRKGGFEEEVDDVANKLVLLYRQNENSAGVVEASLLDTLLEISNTALSKEDKECVKNRKGMRKHSERGFRGTLLHGQSTSSAGNDESFESKVKKVDADNIAAKKASVSDEDSEMKPRISKASKKSPVSDVSYDESVLEQEEETRQISKPRAKATSPIVAVEIMEVDDDDNCQDVAFDDEDRFTAIVEEMKRDNQGDAQLDEVTLAGAVKWALAQPRPNDDASEGDVRSTVLCRYFEVQDQYIGSESRSISTAMEQDSQIQRNLLNQLFDSLNCMFSESHKHEELRLAAQRAVKKNPNGSVADLTEAATAELLEE